MVTVTSAWHEHENAILDALAGLRSLASSTTTPEGAHAGGLVDVVHGSEGAWNAWWTRVDLQGGADVAAIVPDLAPLHAIADGDVDAHGRDLLATLATGRIRVRLLLPDAARSDARARSVVDGLRHAGVEVCTGDARRWFFTASDRVAVVPTTWDEPGDVDALVLTAAPIVAALRELYERRWASARPWGSPTDATQVVLAALERGLADAEVAAELGISVRTVRRRVAEAMTAAGARTRYELAHLRATVGRS